MNIKANEHVYCVDCRFFRLDDEGLPYCCYENKCDINNFEDSKSFTNRPYYEPIVKNKQCYICGTTMEFIDKIEIENMGRCRKYKCPKCNEIIYSH